MIELRPLMRQPQWGDVILYKTDTFIFKGETEWRFTDKHGFTIHNEVACRIAAKELMTEPYTIERIK